MSHDEPTPGNPMLVHDEVANLAMHFFEDGSYHFRVVRRSVQVALARQRIEEFDIGKVDIDDAVEQPDGFKGLIPPTVVYQRQPKTLLDRQRQSGDQLRSDMRRGDEIDVVTTLALQIEHDGSELAGAHRPPFATMVDLPALAELAEEITPGEKDRS